MRAGAVLPLTTIVRVISSADCVRTRTLLFGASTVVSVSGVTGSLTSSPLRDPDSTHSDMSRAMPAE